MCMCDGSLQNTHARAPGHHAPDTTPINLVLCPATCKLLLSHEVQFLASLGCRWISEASLGCRWISDWESRFDWSLVRHSLILKCIDNMHTYYARKSGTETNARACGIIVTRSCSWLGIALLWWWGSDLTIGCNWNVTWNSADTACLMLH